MKPIISIIVPIYNVEKYLPKCIESILNQSFKEFELILVNDGSTDDSGKVCDIYSSKDDRVKVIHKKNGGVSSARNAGLNASCGEYIGFVDPDDYIDKDMYKSLHNLCIDNECDIAICKLGREIDGILINKGEDEFIKVMDNEEAMRELFKGILYRFSLCNKLFKKSCFKNIEFPEGRIHEDLSTTYKLFANSTRAIYINYIGYIYVKRVDSILTKKFYEKRLEAFIGWDEIQKYMNEMYPKLTNQVTASFVYGCVDNIYYILNQVYYKKDIKRYLKVIKLYTKKYERNIMNNKILTIDYKCRIKLLNLHENLFLTFNYLNKKLKAINCNNKLN